MLIGRYGFRIDRRSGFGPLRETLRFIRRDKLAERASRCSPIALANRACIAIGVTIDRLNRQPERGAGGWRLEDRVPS